MLLIISPAKKLDLSEESKYTQNHSLPVHLEESLRLVRDLKKKSAKSLSKLMGISTNLADLNYERFQEFETPFSLDNAKQALLMFNGDVYQSFSLEQYGEEDFAFAQKHLRILSGLYGLLKPLDLIQPYRLEMGTKLKTRRGKNLYEFWGETITKALNQALEEAGDHTLVNLASNEYFKSVRPQKLKGKIITPVFKDERNGQFKTIFLFAKQARGAMSDYVIRNRITSIEGLKGFDGMGYHFHESLSTAEKWVFSR